MQSISSIKPRRTLARLAVDIGLLAGLLLATTIVVVADRHESQLRAKMIDVVFLLDGGPKMRTANGIEPMKANCRKTVDDLKTALASMAREHDRTRTLLAEITEV